MEQWRGTARNPTGISIAIRITSHREVVPRHIELRVDLPPAKLLPRRDSGYMFQQKGGSKKVPRALRPIRKERCVRWWLEMDPQLKSLGYCGSLHTAQRKGTTNIDKT